VDTRPEASFAAAPRVGNVPLTVVFTDQSNTVGSPVKAWLWNFGDGVYSTLPNPVHTYNQPGNFTVSLTVTAASGVDTKSIVNFVQVTERTAFGAIGPAGGSVAATGAIITVPAGALATPATFGVARSNDRFTPSSFESAQVISPAYVLSHNAPSNELIALRPGGGFDASTIEFAFDSSGIPNEHRDSAHVQLLARLENGRTIPIPGVVTGDRLRARVTGLPPRATYAVVYRANAFSVPVNVGKVANLVTGASWAQGWQVGLSEAMIQQLTALRVGTLTTPATYGRRNFSTAEKDATTAALTSAIIALHTRLAGSELRAPVLVDESGAYNVIFYNFLGTYPPFADDFLAIPYADQTFGALVIDPRQLIEVTLKNARALALGTGSADIAQEFDAINAMAIELFSSVYAGYGLGNVKVPTTSGSVALLEGIRAGYAATLGQSAAGVPFARRFGENEVARLSEQLLIPRLAGTPGYATSGQDFFTYIARRYSLGTNINYLSELDENPGGVLEELRRAFANAPQGAPPTYEEALLSAYAAIDRAVRTQLTAAGLSGVYWQYARERAVENTSNARLRPTDADRANNTLDESLFGTGGVVSAKLDAPTDNITIAHAALENIPPLATRAVRVRLQPQTTEATLTFNRAAWSADANGESVRVKVYKEGQAGVELAANRNTLVLRNFEVNPVTCFAVVVVLLSNVNLEDSNSVTIGVQTFAGLTGGEETILDDYVAACDPDYAWEVISSQRIPAARVTITQIRMTTGAWRGLTDLSQTKWSHVLTIVEPDTVASNTCMLIINGGSTGSTPGTPPVGLLPFATEAQAPVAFLYAVPNQPQQFAGETTTRSEDRLLAKSFAKYMDSYEALQIDKTWPALLPMVRSAVSAMDTVQDFMANDSRSRRATSNFVVAGASKRGWTTWLSAVADPRVSGVVPIVIDVLNMDDQIKHHYDAYGFYSSALQPYVDENVFNELDSDAGQSLLKIVDPYSYLDRLTMPKFIVNSTGDQFFLPDSSQFYYADLTGEKYLYYAPNTDHGLTGNVEQIDEGSGKAILAWYLASVKGLAKPTYNWTYEAENRISVTTNRTPKSVRLWQATNSSNRDFRLETIGPRWTATDLLREDGAYTAEVEVPSTGYTAYFVQITWQGPVSGVDADFSFTTPVKVIPDVYPVPNAR